MLEASRRRDGRAVGLTGLHVQPRLAVGDMSARQALILPVMKNQMLRLTPKLLWLGVAGVFGVNSIESEGEQTGIIREQFRGG
jgi:hypothetical protein